ncbi:MAG: hypothetical protein AVDCRST_MAG73-41 [uncultured Thermomicrobiales bacterium]|uniref:Putative restriction endonuclease domain-containing protein n=1 Tax=uncultured Thermomicrobiales bacterium TaxID=1645740 RepID=A0A6J4TAF4_9BACT|nr:MAG: hypothetical protein AVDCRST_MAG73-41 [uncultured Thermomicrobiales bacterium]
MPVTERTYETVALEDPEGFWELWGGRLREKPGMSWEHGEGMLELGYSLRDQLGRDRYRVRINHARARRSETTVFIPDVAVIPIAYGEPLRGRPGTLEIYDDPLPFVAEIWSRSTGDYDVDAKLPEYQSRGDLEIWRLHPYDRTVTVWRRQPDGSYQESFYRGGVVPVLSLPGVTIDLDALFD